MLDAITMQKPPVAATSSPAPPGLSPQAQPTTAPAVEPATFISPRMTFDRDAQMIITQVRDRSTGEVKNQFPAEAVVEKYKSAGQAVATQEGNKPAPGVTDGEAAGTDFSGTVQSGGAAGRHTGIMA